MEWSNWAYGKPQGGERDNCVAIWSSVMVDISCSLTEYVCPICEFDKEASLYLRGATSSRVQGCRELTLLDESYSLNFQNAEMGRYGINGWLSTLVKWSAINSRWEITDQTLSNTTIAFTNTSDFDYPLGRQRWHFLNEQCNEPGKTWRYLTLDSCCLLYTSPSPRD